jgi:hypothetical protein
MLKQLTFVGLVLLVSILSGCQSAQGSKEIEQVKQQLAAIESRLDEIDQNANGADLDAASAESLVARVEVLEAHAQAMPDTASHDAPAVAVGAQAQVFEVTTAAYLMDTAGFHDLDDRVNEEGTILPGDAGLVHRVNQILLVTDWPAGLEAKASQLVGILEEYATALANDDLEAAKPLAAAAHEAQHDLSHAIETWLAEVNSQAEPGEMEHMHDQEAAHADHSAHHGGLVGMSGDLHLEIVSAQAGEYQVYLSDAFRQPINPEGVSGTLVLMPGMDDEMELPLQVMHGEYLAASGGPTDVNAMDVSIRLDDTPEGQVEMDFTLSYEEESEHEHDDQGEHEHDDEG